MRLIDADTLGRYLNDCNFEENAKTGRKREYKTMCRVLKCIENAPTVDAVPVVRCEDCKFGEKGRIFDSDCIWCGTGTHQEAKPMHFYCARGERRENHAAN